MHSLFGTDGIRGSVTSGVFSTQSLIMLGNAIGRWITRRYGYRPTIIIGYDTRYSAQRIKEALLTGCTILPVDILDAQIIPTPAAAHLLKLMPHVAAAIIISASHNSSEDNGIKLFDQKQGKLTVEDEQEITAYYYEQHLIEHRYRGSVLPLNHARATYLQHIYTEILPIDLYTKRRQKYHVVLDLANGATTSIATELFEKYGAKVTTLHSQPNGYNINENSGSVHPQVLQDTVLRVKADIGFAFDGDGDRVVAVNRHGQLKNGDDLLCILLDHPHYQNTTTIVGTIMTNGGLEQYVAERGMTLLRTPVGDRFIMNTLKHEKLLLGGEPVGHIILRNHLYTGDGLLVALKILETIEMTNNWDMITFSPYEQITQKIKIDTHYNLGNELFESIVHNARNRLRQGRIVVRYSGTEPVLRIMVESRDVSQAVKECATLVERFECAFKELS
jgi:phosphoglucosamine mutase